MKRHEERKGATQPRETAVPRPAGEQAISPELYQQIRQAVRDLGPAER